jgi:hypothetical protein
MASTVTIELADGRRFAGRAENGMLEPGELGDKFLRLTRRALGEPGAGRFSSGCSGSRTRGTWIGWERPRTGSENRTLESVGTPDNHFVDQAYAMHQDETL